MDLATVTDRQFEEEPVTFGESPIQGDESVRRLIRPIDEARGWMKLLAVLLIIQGALAAITIIGLLIAWLPIWLGILLWQSAERAQRAREAGDESIAVDALVKIKTLFTIYGVIALIGLVVWGFFLLVIVVAAITGAFNNN